MSTAPIATRRGTAPGGRDPVMFESGSRKHKTMARRKRRTPEEMKTLNVARRYIEMRRQVDGALRRIAALSGVLRALEDANPPQVRVDDIAFVAGMIQVDAYDILENLDNFAAPADLQEKSEPE